MHKKYGSESDALMIFLSLGGLHAEGMGDIVIHVNEDGDPFLLEVLNPSKDVRASMWKKPPLCIEKMRIVHT